MYPIELHHVGDVNGNLGVGEVLQAFVPSSSGKLTLFLDTQDMQSKWMRTFEKSTGSHNIKDYYNFDQRSLQELEKIKKHHQASGQAFSQRAFMASNINIRLHQYFS